MSLEHVQSTTEEVVPVNDAIFLAEEALVAPEHLPMLHAQFNACFPHFQRYIEKEIPEAWQAADSRDADSIASVVAVYQDYRDWLEASLEDINPDKYKAYIACIAQGDEHGAIAHINEFLTKEDDEEEE